jgi:hypothetical protein
MAFTDTVDQAFLDYFLDTYTLWAGYGTSAPAKAGTGATEPTDVAYGRIAVESSPGMARTASTIDNDGAITFPTATEDQGTITYAYLFDAEADGNLIWYGALTTPKAVTTGDAPRFPAGDFDITQA